MISRWELEQAVRASPSDLSPRPNHNRQTHIGPSATCPCWLWSEHIGSSAQAAGLARRCGAGIFGSDFEVLLSWYECTAVPAVFGWQCAALCLVFHVPGIPDILFEPAATSWFRKCVFFPPAQKHAGHTRPLD